MRIVEPEIDDYVTGRLREQSLGSLSNGTGRVSDETLRALDRALEKAVAAADPKGAYKRSLIDDVTATGVVIREGEVRSARFATLARAARGERPMVVFALATVGGTFSEVLDAEESLLDKYVLDAVGSQLAEIVADLVETEWRNDLAASGYDSSLRMSPGCCDWDLDGQNVVFTILDASAIGVRLAPGYLMIPEKSASSASVAAESVPMQSACSACGKNECPFRKRSLDQTPGPELPEDDMVEDGC